jgi:hypothetical protein
MTTRIDNGKSMFWWFSKPEQYSEQVQAMMIEFMDRGFLVFATYASDNN